MKPEIELINLQTLASGDKLELKIYKFTGKNQGKKDYIKVLTKFLLLVDHY